jgi:hypothetical protein
MIAGRVKLLLRILGATSIAVGFGCLPLGYGVNPKRDLSIFENFADLGMFVTMGLILMPVGVGMLVLSWVLPGDEPEDFL